MGEIRKILFSWIVMMLFVGCVIGIIAAASDVTEFSVQLQINILIVILCIAISILFGLFTARKDR